MLKHHGIEVVERQPLPKTWSGKDRKITHEELAYFAPVPKSRTNPEERDAALLAWNHAALPVRVKPKMSNPKSSCRYEEVIHYPATHDRL